MDVILRALAIYLILLIVFKVAGRRTLMQMTNFDLILLLIISEATQQAMLGSDFSVTGSALCIITLIVVDISLGYLKDRFSGIENFIDSTPVILVENGHPLMDKINKVDVSIDDILVAARQSQGILNLKDIKFAILERNGQISVIPGTD